MRWRKFTANHKASGSRRVLGFMAGLPGYGNQVDAEAFIDQEPHDAAMVSRFRRPRRTGC